MTDATDTDLRPFSIRSGSSAREALQAIRQNHSGIVAVIGDDDTVVGTVTDGNIRRAALRGTSLEAPVQQVMSCKPVHLPVEAGPDEVSRILAAHRLRAAPVVDQGRLVGVHSSTWPHTPAPIAVVMAGGRGQRLRPFTDKVPKPLLRVGPLSIVERIILSLADAGVREVFLAVNYKAELLEERLGNGQQLGVDLSYVREEKPMGTAGSLSVLSDPRGPVLVTNGDIVTTVDFTALLDFHWHHGAAVTVAGVPYVSSIPYGVLRTAEHHLISMEEKPQRRELCSAGIYVLAPEVLRFVPPGVPWDMPDLIIDVLAEGLSVQVFPILETWVDIGGTDEFERVLVQFAVGEEGADDTGPGLWP